VSISGGRGGSGFKSAQAVGFEMRKNNINIQVNEDVAGVLVPKGTRYIFHVCCRCGCRHKVVFEWPKDGVVMKWYEAEDKK